MWYMGKDGLKIGTISWVDLTVDNADTIRDFYSSVVGWKSDPVPMGDHEDYVMLHPKNKSAVSGICHKLGENAHLPSQWLMYITVENLEESLELCKDMGGEQLAPVKDTGDGQYAVIKDPAGAVVALYQENLLNKFK